MFPDHLAVYVRQTEVAAGVAVGQPLVVEAQQVQNRRVQVVDAGRLVDGLEAEVIGGAVNRAAAHAAAGHPHAEAVRVVVAAELRFAVAAEFDRRRATELAAPDDQRVVEHAALLQIGEQRGDRLIDLLRETSVIRFDLCVGCPTAGRRRAKAARSGRRVPVAAGRSASGERERPRRRAVECAAARV